MVREVLIRLIAIGALIAAGTAAVAAEGRHALVVGVNDYQNVPKLQKAVGDARAMKTALERAGFTVDFVLNPDRRGFNLAISNFSRKLRAGDVALFHFSGHGVALDGENYLLPTDVPAPGDGDKELLKLEAMPLTGVLERIRDAGARTEILIIDACRDNPYAGRGKRSFGVRGGLAQIQPPRGPGGVFILYSAGYGQTAADRLNDKDTEPTSVYTRTLLRKITVEGKPITDIAREVREDVEALAATIGHAQRPAYYDELSGPPFYFVPPSGKSQTAARSPAIELAFWNSIKDSRNAALFRDYLAKFGDRAVFASIAHAKIRELAAPAQPPAVQPQPQSPRPIVPPVAALPTPDANNFQPSFDCAQDTGRIEQVICANAALAARDRMMAGLYYRMVDALGEGERIALRSVQRDWLTQRRGCEREPDDRIAACIAQAYDQRIAELQRLTGGLTQLSNLRSTTAPPSAPPVAAIRPSFDCAGETGIIERTICADTSLAARDRRLADLYTQLRKRVDSASARALRDAQRVWLRQRNQCRNRGAGIKACLADAYDRRIGELADLGGR